MKKLKEFFTGIPETLTLTGLEGILAITVGVLAGVVIGMLCSPRRSINLGSNNDNRHTTVRKLDEEDDGDEEISF